MQVSVFRCQEKKGPGAVGRENFFISPQRRKGRREKKIKTLQTLGLCGEQFQSSMIKSQNAETIERPR